MYFNRYRLSKQNSHPTMVKCIVLIFALVLIITSLLSAVFIVAHINHEHNNHGPRGRCTTCIHLGLAEKLFNKSFILIVLPVFIFTLYLFFILFLRPFISCVSPLTLHSLKVRLNI